MDEGHRRRPRASGGLAEPARAPCASLTSFRALPARSCPGPGLCPRSRNRFSSLGLPFLQPGLKWLPDVRLPCAAAAGQPRAGLGASALPPCLSLLPLSPPSIPGSRPRKRKQEASQGHYIKPLCRGRDPAGNRRPAAHLCESSRREAFWDDTRDRGGALPRGFVCSLVFCVNLCRAISPASSVGRPARRKARIRIENLSPDSSQ